MPCANGRTPTLRNTSLDSEAPMKKRDSVKPLRASHTKPEVNSAGKDKKVLVSIATTKNRINQGI